MPIYEFGCQECGKKSSFLVLSVYSQFEKRCQHCGSPDLIKLVSRVAVLRSEDSRLESLADPSKLGDLDESDPKSLARWMKKYGREMGEELGSEFDEELDRAVEEVEKGQFGRESEPATESDLDSSSAGLSGEDYNDLDLAG
ncbi:MAG: zinc ribbon domain-containing protein [Acidobacteriota bacterium]|nr:zinc ribbon domain-containing protein [Acidobacteriota bacterium]MDY0231366.1 zinc ribbon domain-containing protein [Candidatus Saccharicenans sp.]